ncbi:hypothetical protein [Reyranella sp.]|uniref:hypothetical protein n=1 Tax=Reyranella sp. TaxID=1929291 RepID=UPI00387E4007
MWKSWTSGLGRKGRALFHPLRLALTGQETGPEMAKLLPLISRSRAMERLHGREAWKALPWAANCAARTPRIDCRHVAILSSRRVPRAMYRGLRPSGPRQVSFVF